MNSVSRCTPLAVVVVILLMLNQCSHVKGAKHWRVAFDRFIPPMEIGEEKIVNFMLLDLNKIELQESSATIRVVSGDSDVVDAYKEIPVSEINDGKWNGSVRLEAVFLGGTEISVKIGRQIENKWFIERSKGFLPIQVIRIRVPMWMYDEIYNIFEHALYITIGIILGMAIDWHKVGANLRKPVGVGISFFCSYVFMPLTGYALGFVLFPGNSEMQFVLFVIGACIMKGISNMWTVLLNGNIELSVTITIIHTLLACGILPLWILTLGTTKLPDTQLKIQKQYYALFVVKGVIPLGVGALIKHCVPIPRKYLMQLLKMLSIIYIAFNTIHAAAMSFDLLTSKFSLTWKYFLTGLLLPLFGYTCSSLLAYAFRQRHEDRLAIAVDTINFNMVIASSTSSSNLQHYSPKELAIFLSNLMSIMTPIPLLFHFIWTKIRSQTAPKT